MKMQPKQNKRYRRGRRVRAKILGTAKKPRLSVFRSSKHIYAQIIDDEKGVTLAAASDKEIKKSPHKAVLRQRAGKIKEDDQELRAGNVAVAYEVGKLIAQKALAKKIEKVVFDRGGYKYHGRIKAVADGARGGGLKF